MDKQRPNYEYVTDGAPVYAVQLQRTRESLAEFCRMTGIELPTDYDVRHLQGFRHQGTDYDIGDWMVCCKCGHCDDSPYYVDERVFKQEFTRIIRPQSFLDDLIFSAPAHGGYPGDLPTAPFGLHIPETKQFRKDIDAVLQRVKGSSRQSDERSRAIVKLQEAIMWLGMDLKDLGTPSPYPSSYDPSSPVVEPTADGLKL